MKMSHREKRTPNGGNIVFTKLVPQANLWRETMCVSYFTQFSVAVSGFVCLHGR